MKNNILLSMLVSMPIICFSQVRTGAFKYEVLDPNTAGKIFKNPPNTTDKILGTPYYQTMFASAKVENVENKAIMRYNAYRDEFEFIDTKRDTLVLDKIDDFGMITFQGTNKTYKLIRYSNNVEKLHQGYLIELYQKANYVLYKREWMTFYAGKKAKTSLESDMPPKYIKENDSYYLKDINGNVTDFPDSKKQLSKLFPEKKEVLEAFIKENKISFDKEEDMKKIINLLTTF